MEGTAYAQVVQRLLAAGPMPLNPAEQDTVLRVAADAPIWSAHLARLLMQSGLSGEQACTAVRLLRLTDLAEGDPATVAVLAPLAGQEGDTSLRTLAAVPPDELAEAIRRTGRPDLDVQRLLARIAALP